MDRNVEVQTPESIAFAYQLAGLGSRFLAVVTDIALQLALFVGLVWGITALAARTSVHAPVTSRAAAETALAFVIFVIFTIFFGYFILFEAFWHGQTPGKKLLGIRVVRDGGYPLDLSASLIRNLIRIAESLLGFYAMSAVSALASRENKRIGDFAAGTIVVRDAKILSPASLAHAFSEPTYASTSFLDGEERELVHRFIERRDSLPPARRAYLAGELAARIRPRVSPELAQLPDESLLERL